jgi:hypothetical protein
MPLIPKTKEEHIGIELECLVDKEALAKLSRFDGLTGLRNTYQQYASFLEIGTDGSIHDTPNERGLEFRLLTTPGKISQHLLILKKILVQLKARVNTSCGLHVHLDMRRGNVHQAFANLVRSQRIWLPIIRKDRWEKFHCYRTSTVDFHTQLKLGNRYSSVNAHSYTKYKTLEVRVHQGTVSIPKIIKWVNLLRACSKSDNVSLEKHYVMEVA